MNLRASNPNPLTKKDLSPTNKLNRKSNPFEFDKKPQDSQTEEFIIESPRKRGEFNSFKESRPSLKGSEK